MRKMFEQVISFTFADILQTKYLFGYFGYKKKNNYRRFNVIIFLCLHDYICDVCASHELHAVILGAANRVVRARSREIYDELGSKRMTRMREMQYDSR